MQRLTHLLRALAFLACCGAAPAAAQTASLRDELLKDWLQMKQTMHAVAERMPADRYTFRATPQQRDFGQQVVHVANANLLNLAFLRGNAKPPTVDRTATAKETAIAAMDASFDYGEALIREQTDATLMQVVETNRFLGQSSRARVVYFLLGHAWDIYGQMVVYLRLNGGTPPASERP
jgi:uncharacterized damage-inducible protein DinB